MSNFKKEVVESLQAALTFQCRDMGVDHRDAWIYGIVVGWEEDALKELAIEHGWNKETVLRLQRLHEEFVDEDH